MRPVLRVQWYIQVVFLCTDNSCLGKTYNHWARILKQSLYISYTPASYMLIFA